MRIYKFNKKIFVFLLNPKCGVQLLLRILKNVKKLKVLKGKIQGLKECNNNYSHHNYYHTNLKGAILYLKNKKISLKNVIFVCLIRNPFQRFLSAYWYTQYFQNKDEKLLNNINYHKSEFNNFFDCKHYNNFTSKKFRFFKGCKVNEIIRLENIYEDFLFFFNKYNFKFNKENFKKILKEKVNVSKRLVNLSFTEEQKKYILENWKEDFEDGKYDTEY